MGRHEEVPAEMTPPLPRAMFLDIGGVLLDFDHAIAWRRLSVIARVEVEEVREFLIETGLARKFDLGEVYAAEFFAMTRRRFALSLEEDAFARLWADIFTPKEEVLRLLPALASALPLYILSNTDPIHFGHIERTYGLSRHFRDRVLSYEVGARKPDEGIYRAALALADRPPEESLFFDDIEANVAAARRLGIRAHLFTGVEGMKRVLGESGILRL